MRNFMKIFNLLKSTKTEMGSALKRTVNNKRELSTNINVVLLEGVRTPFHTQGTKFLNNDAYELAGHTINGAINRNKIDKSELEFCIFGQAFQDILHLNVARDAAIYVGLDHLPCETVTNMQASSLSALTAGYARIKSGHANMGLVGGVEFLTQVPMSIHPLLYEIHTKFNVKFPYICEWDRFSLRSVIENFISLNFVAEILNPFTKKCPLLEAEIFSYRFKDYEDFKNQLTNFAYNSMLNMDICRKNRHTDKISVWTQTELIDEDDLDFEERVSELYAYDLYPRLKAEPYIGEAREPAIKGEDVEYFPASSSYIPRLSDGAACTIVMKESAALARKLTPKAFIRDIVFSSSNVIYNSLEGGIASLGILLAKNSLCIEDISVLEINENTGIESLYTKKILENSDEIKKSIYQIPRRYKFLMNLDETMNSWGGSIGFGNPFGATGIRLINMACNRLQSTPNGRYAVVTTNSHGAIGCSVLLENYI